MGERVQVLDGDSLNIKRRDNPNTMWEDFPVAGIPARNVFGYFNDFVDWVADSWTVTEVGTCTQTLADEENGVLVLTSGGTEDNGNNLQLGGTGDGETTGESFKPAVGRTIWYETRVKYDDATQSDLLAGLSVQDTTSLDTAVGIFFRKDDGDLLVDCVSTASASLVSSDLGAASMANNTYIILGFKVFGLDKVEFWINNVKVATHSISANIPATEMKLTFLALTGEGNAAALSVDYVACYQTR